MPADALSDCGIGVHSSLRAFLAENGRDSAEDRERGAARTETILTAQMPCGHPGLTFAGG
jgi:hypothetical protein